MKSERLNRKPAHVVAKEICAQTNTPYVLTDTQIEGPLSLRGHRIERDIVLERCTFDAPLDLTGTHLWGLSLRDSSLQGLEAGELNCDRTLDLIGIECEGCIFLRLAHIRGNVALDDARVSCRDAFSARNGGAHSDQTDVARDGIALNANGLHCSGSLRLVSAELDGDVLVSLAEVRELRCDHARIERRSGTPLEVDDPSLVRPIFNANGLRCTGSLSMKSARIAGPVYMRLAKVDGNFDVRGARLGVDTPRASGERPSSFALQAAAIACGGELLLSSLDQRSEFIGSVNLQRSTAGSISCFGARFSGTGPNASSMSLEGMLCTGSVRIVDIQAPQGAQFELHLSLAGVDGDLQLGSSVQFDGAYDPAERVAWRSAVVSLRNSRVGRLRFTTRGAFDGRTTDENGNPLDNEARWPDKIAVTGLAYEHFEPADLYQDFISRWAPKHIPGPYARLADCLRNDGHRLEAREVLLQRDGQLRHSGPALNRAERAIDWLRAALFRRGYGPHLAFSYLLFIVLCVIGVLEYVGAQRAIAEQMTQYPNWQKEQPILAALCTALPCDKDLHPSVALARLLCAGLLLIGAVAFVKPMEDRV